MRTILIMTTTLLTLTACGGTSTGSAGTGGPGTPGGVTAMPGTLSGQVLDERGTPVQDALIITEPASYTGAVFTRTDAQGRYRTVELNTNVAPYYAYAYKQVTYNGRAYCVRLAGETGTEYDAYNPKAGAVKNWRWRLSGPADSSDAVWGGTVKLENVAQLRDDPAYVEWNVIVELTFTPAGPLIDGSVGDTVVLQGQREAAFKDIPVGKYTVTAREVQADGTRTLLRLNTKYSEAGLAQQITMMFNGFESCGHMGTFPSTMLFIAR